MVPAESFNDTVLRYNVLPLRYKLLQRAVLLPRSYVTLAAGIMLPVTKTLFCQVVTPEAFNVVNAPVLAVFAPMAPVR